VSIAGRTEEAVRSHTIKAGLHFGTGWFETRQDAQADLEQDYRTGVLDSVVIRNTPFDIGTR
jgi:hypothetical protein